ncbi:Protein of unknown function [Franzmannia pantelleriensis]|uniref:DUF2914 domain-containing protein n=1 Tax=Franzmannia pantelleriensis TaxID=48727 RepID=A0A1G9VAS0_9GAMM|nr:DUF5924 family protein [Halomonas pantelleriensis]SDM69292.1 Protein of unknown function [Halomonas pantelleriensis]
MTSPCETQASNAPVPRNPARAERLALAQRGVERLLERVRPYLWVWPPIAFAAGMASFFLVDRQQWLGAALALGMLLAWLLLLSESVIGRALSRRGYPTLPRGATTFIAQLIHQETLFFSLPFLLATTVWASGQALFTLLILGLALLSILDPLYFKLAERYRWVYFAFHAQCVFVVVLVTLPIMFQLTTSQSLFYALALMVVFSLPSLMHLVRPKRLRSWLAMLGLTLLLASAAWAGRAWVPPANLWLTGSALAPHLDVETRTPNGSVALTRDALAESGLYAYTAIRAPRGLQEEIFHEWRHAGELIDRIPLTIHGGRQQGYRAWTRKQNFPAEADGRWRVDVVTASGQRLGVLRFTVSDSPASADMADGQITSPPGIPGLDLRRLVPGAH